MTEQYIQEIPDDDESSASSVDSLASSHASSSSSHSLFYVEQVRLTPPTARDYVEGPSSLVLPLVVAPPSRAVISGDAPNPNPNPKKSSSPMPRNRRQPTKILGELKQLVVSVSNELTEFRRDEMKLPEQFLEKCETKYRDKSVFNADVRKMYRDMEEPAKSCSWDVLLKEMEWIAKDFIDERKWKKGQFKKLIRGAVKEVEKRTPAVIDEEKELRRRAAVVANDVQRFWKLCGKVVRFRHQQMVANKLREERQRVLDRLMEKTGSMVKTMTSDLTGSMMTCGAPPLATTKEEEHESSSSSVKLIKEEEEENGDKNSRTSTKKRVKNGGGGELLSSSKEDEHVADRTTSSSSRTDTKEEQCPTTSNHDGDTEYCVESDTAEEESDDDISSEEEPTGSDEGDELRADAEMSIEEILKRYRDKTTTIDDNTSSSCPPKVDDKHVGDGEEEYTAENSEDSLDDEETMEEQEKMENEETQHEEAETLLQESNIPISELLAKYRNEEEASSDGSRMSSSSREGIKRKDCNDDDGSPNLNTTQHKKRKTTAVVNSENNHKYSSSAQGEISTTLQTKETGGWPKTRMCVTKQETTKNEDKTLESITEEMMSAQPTGNTLDTTQVSTPVPFLLQLKMREYQVVGLHWLATLHSKNLNGILADEMGLGKTIQTISLFAHLACQHGIWGPHLIIVPTSVLLNWEIELKRWCPGLKILTYYGSQQERKIKRTGWSKPYSFHVCISSYTLVLQDAAMFRRKQWYYMVLDEAQNIKNFKSQRWQTLLTFNTQRRLLLTGTPLQNDLLELWSLMHFLMPGVFQSHSDFKEWFSDPLTAAIEKQEVSGEQSLIKRLHSVLRPFLLRRLKKDVEQQMPSKYEHVLACPLSKRQRALYEEFMMSRRAQECLNGTEFIGMMNVLMQLRKVCNHPELFEPRDVESSLVMDEALCVRAPSLVSLHLHESCNLGIENRFTLLTLPILNLMSIEQTTSRAAAQRRIELKPKSTLVSLRDEREPMSLEDILAGLNLVVDNQDSSSKIKLHEIVDMKRLEDPLSCLIEELRSCGAMVEEQIAHLDKVSSCCLRSGAQSASHSQGLHQHHDIVGKKSTVSVSDSEEDDHIECDFSVEWFQCGECNRWRCLGDSSRFTAKERKLIRTSELLSCAYLVGMKCQGDSDTDACSRQVKWTELKRDHEADILRRRNQNKDPETLCSSLERSPSVENEESLMFSLLRTPTSTLPPSNLGSCTTEKARGCSPLCTDLNLMSPSLSKELVPPLPQKAQLLCGDDPKLLDLLTAPQSWDWPESSGSSNLGFASIPSLSDFVLNQLYSDQKKQETKRVHTNVLVQASVERLVLLSNAWRTGRIQLMDELNRTRINEGVPILGTDSVEACLSLLRGRLEPNRNSTDAIQEMIPTAVERMEALCPLLKYAICALPRVRSRLPLFLLEGFSGFSDQRRSASLLRPVETRLLKAHSEIHKVNISFEYKFPDPRMLQWDCGKLGVLDTLLKRLHEGAHRCLIFTQMSRMLDVLEQFINLHRYTYLRLDGSTKVENRQRLVEAFNANKKIFLFISSTRAGGIGLNLTGADTVIFYDSDWNPAMDRQAMDRCHRIGQTRDVHIYRLISEHTIEENILRKQLQKRQLDDIVVDQGKFTTDFLTRTDVRDVLIKLDDTSDLYKTRVLHTQLLSEECEGVAVMKIEQNKDDLAELEVFEKTLQDIEEADDVAALKVANLESKNEQNEFCQEFAAASKISTPTAEDVIFNTTGRDLCKKSESMVLRIDDRTTIELTSLLLYGVRFLEKFFPVEENIGEQQAAAEEIDQNAIVEEEEEAGDEEAGDEDEQCEDTEMVWSSQDSSSSSSGEEEEISDADVQQKESENK